MGLIYVGNIQQAQQELDAIIQARSGKQNRCSFLGPGEAALGFGQSVLFLTKKPGVVNVGTIGEKGKGLEGLIHRLVKPLQ
nr:hypothetical protein [Ktedonobacter sp. SOSP1-85]